jgi:hypothetical protein
LDWDAEAVGVVGCGLWVGGWGFEGEGLGDGEEVRKRTDEKKGKERVEQKARDEKKTRPEKEKPEAEEKAEREARKLKDQQGDKARKKKEHEGPVNKSLTDGKGVAVRMKLKQSKASTSTTPRPAEKLEAARRKLNGLKIVVGGKAIKMTGANSSMVMKSSSSPYGTTDLRLGDGYSSSIMPIVVHRVQNNPFQLALPIVRGHHHLPRRKTCLRHLAQKMRLRGLRRHRILHHLLHLGRYPGDNKGNTGSGPSTFNLDAELVNYQQLKAFHIDSETAPSVQCKIGSASTK